MARKRFKTTTERYRAPCGIDVYTYVGDINNIPDATAAVTGEGVGFENESLITQALLGICPDFRRTRDTVKRKNRSLKAWNVRTSKLNHESKFRYIFHAVLKHQRDDYWIEGVKKMYKRLFKKVEKYEVSKLALPLLGSGRAHADVFDAVRAVVESITLIPNSHRRHLQQIYLVTMDTEYADSMATYCQLYFQNPSDAKPHRRASLRYRMGLGGNKFRGGDTHLPDPKPPLQRAKSLPTRGKSRPQNESGSMRGRSSQSRTVFDPSFFTTPQSAQVQTQMNTDTAQLLEGRDTTLNRQSMFLDGSKMASAQKSFQRNVQAVSTTEKYRAICGIDVFTYVGDINDVPDATAAVTEEGVGFQQESVTTQALVGTCPELRRKRDKMKSRRLKAWTVRRSTLNAESRFRYIFHAVLGTQEDEYWVEGMKKLYKALFKKAEKYKVHTLALPLLGSSRAGAEAVRAVTENITLIRGRRNLQNIYLLTLDQQHADTMATFCKLYFQNPSAVQPRMNEFGGPKWRERGMQKGYTKELEELREVARRKGFTWKETGSGRDIFTSLSQQLTYGLREEIDPGHLRVVVAHYLRSCQSNKDNSVEGFLKGTSLEEVLTSIEEGDNVESDIIISAVCNALNLEVLMLAASGEELLFQPFGEKEFLPQIVLGAISEKRFVNIQHEESRVAPDIPTIWSLNSKDTELITLRAESVEFQEVQQSFLSSIGGSKYRNVIQIKRVQSTIQWKHFNISRKEMAHRYHDMTSERRLWHGTSEESISLICKEGFNRSFCGKNATLYGEGVYFSEASSYAAHDIYSVPGEDGFKYMFRALVLTGHYTKGKRGMKVPPLLDEKELVRFDSVVDNIDQPTMFVIFHDTKAYPEYIIKFK